MAERPEARWRRSMARASAFEGQHSSPGRLEQPRRGTRPGTSYARPSPGKKAAGPAVQCRSGMRQHADLAGQARVARAWTCNSIHGTATYTAPASEVAAQRRRAARNKIRTQAARRPRPGRCRPGAPRHQARLAQVPQRRQQRGLLLQPVSGDRVRRPGCAPNMFPTTPMADIGTSCATPMLTASKIAP
jgi:hypothetical protein